MSDGQTDICERDNGHINFTSSSYKGKALCALRKRTRVRKDLQVHGRLNVLKKSEG